MGDVAIVFRVMPMSRDSNLEEIKKEISKAVKPKQIMEKPIAFGLKALEVLVVVPDSVGPAELEEKMRRVHNIASVEIDSVTLL
jgi:translation elongation factor aEF-1 beta